MIHRPPTVQEIPSRISRPRRVNDTRSPRSLSPDARRPGMVHLASGNPRPSTRPRNRGPCFNFQHGKALSPVPARGGCMGPPPLSPPRPKTSRSGSLRPPLRPGPPGDGPRRNVPDRRPGPRNAARPATVLEWLPFACSASTLIRQRPFAWRYLQWSGPSHRGTESLTAPEKIARAPAPRPCSSRRKRSNARYHKPPGDARAPNRSR